MGTQLGQIRPDGTGKKKTNTLNMGLKTVKVKQSTQTHDLDRETGINRETKDETQGER